MTSTVTGLLLTTDLNQGDRVPLLLADDGDRLDHSYLSGVLTLGDGDTDREICEVEEYPGVRLLVGRLARPGDRQRNQIAGLVLDQYFRPAANRWWLDLHGGVVITGLCHCGCPCDLPDPVYDTARSVSDSIPRGNR
ncbi:hypothetical protein HNP84_002487 [Thermocatellispora tengchongensis]|uniref:Uncharacterized protein n=1 Tax=Thermocatellispora tengchongensis TaxID=1073253 RepID=A0A840P2P0_9ACTN|nr:hypothetical protein [Thermocatellispora tengchongensis]MBB5132766.1 hypothetical protein [Thermocatellispora tengchongensis]